MAVSICPFCGGKKPKIFIPCENCGELPGVGDWFSIWLTDQYLTEAGLGKVSNLLSQLSAGQCNKVTIEACFFKPGVLGKNYKPNDAFVYFNGRQVAFLAPSS